MKALKSVVEAARLLGISTWTVRAWERQGNLNAVRIGRRVLFEEAELERFIAQRRNIQAAGAGTSAPASTARLNEVHDGQ